tara:strand:+ start:4101 stop:5249 length:1149 start_codon:yes stop_codon:yes gene_type:complete
MKLLNTISFLIEQDLEELGLSPGAPWHEKVFQSTDHESLWPIIKLFGGDIHEIYRALDRRGKGEDFLEHITYMWPEDDHHLMHIIDALGGMRNWNNGKMDNDLVDKYVIDVYLDDMLYIQRDKNGRIILELMPGEEAEFFSEDGGGRSYDCNVLAKEIFSEEGLDWEPYDEVDSIENLIKDLSEESYIKLVRHIGIEFQNEEVDAWREEWDEVREDNGKVIITPSFMNGFLPGTESSRYALAVLIGNTPELHDIEIEIGHAYSRAWNDVVINQYYTEFHRAFEEFLGKPLGEGTTSTYKDVVDPETGKKEWKNIKVPVKYFDVTDRARAMIVRHAHDIDSPEDFLSMIKEFDMNTLCPQVDEYPYDEEEVNNLFQEYLWDYL